MGGGRKRESVCGCMEKGGGCRGRKERYTNTFENVWGKTNVEGERSGTQRESVCVCNNNNGLGVGLVTWDRA
jgi:hypothetical protein